MNMIESRKAKAGQGGFTLIELLVVIAILGILAGVAVIGIGAMRENAKKQVCKADLDTLTTVAHAYVIDEDNAVPAAGMTLNSATAPSDVADLLERGTTSTATVTIDSDRNVTAVSSSCP